MDKQQSKDWKTRINKMLQALRLLAEDNSPATVAEKLGIKHPENLYRLLKLFREVDFPFMSQIVAAVRKEKLLEKSKWDWARKARESKIRRAEQGFFMGTRPTGYRMLDGKLIEIKDELKKIDGVLHDFRVEYKDPAQLAKKYDLPLSTVHRILENPVYKGEFDFLGKTYKGHWKPRITPEEFDEIQSMRHGPPGGYRLSKLLYRWKDDKWVGKPGAKELAKTIVEMRLQQKSGKAIAKELKIGRKVVYTVLKDRRITGTDEFESLIDKDLWEAAQKVHVPTYQELEQKRSRERKQQIMAHVPAYRWEIREKIGLSKAIINNLVVELKKDVLKERADGLLQKAWEPFPDTVLTTRLRSKSKRIKKILELLHTEKKMKLVELQRKTGFSEPCVQMHISRLRRMGVVERQDYWGYQIKDNWVKYIAKWLSQPHIAKL